MLENSDILMRSQTYAFTVLALAELFHAVGMRDINTSVFRFKHFDNKVMILAFVVGFLGQLAVTKIPFLVSVFGTVSLSLVEWACLFGAALIPLVMHEFMVLRNRYQPQYE